MSRDLDVRVAEAMGWTLRETGFPVNFWLGPDGMATGYCDQPWPEDAERYGDAPVLFSGKGAWSPRTDIAAAWRVVEWMRERGWYIAMDWDKRRCSVWVSCESKFPAWVTGPEFPEALCRAFLEAVEATDA